MTEEFNLSNKIYNSQRQYLEDNKWIHIEDFKEFIKRLEEDIEFGEEHKKIIKKLAGEKLSK